MRSYIILFAFCIPLLVFGQNKPQIGIEGNLLIHNTSASYQDYGIGQSIYTWLEQPINSNHSIRLKLGIHNQLGYSLKAAEFEERSFPTEYQRISINRQLAGLYYQGIAMTWRYQPSESRFSYLAGLQLSRLNRVKGKEYHNIWYSNQEVEVSKNSLGSSWHTGNKTLTNNSLDPSYFYKTYWYLLMQVAYEISPGLHLKAGIQQSLQPLMKNTLSIDSKNFRSTALTLGFSAQLF